MLFGEVAYPNFERTLMADNAKCDEVKQQKVTEENAAGAPAAGNWNIDLLLDVELPISVSFGHSEMSLKDVMKLGPGSVIELEKSVNDPVTIAVNRKPIARGEVVTVDGKYGVRILEVESTANRIRSLG
jgi:flagellar motor switch protein FliN/FliY